MAPSSLAFILVRTALAIHVLVPCPFAVAGATQGLGPRQNVTFEVTQTTAFGTSIYVVGDLPELGSNSSANAIKLSPAAYPLWRASISLPAGRGYSYRFIARADGPGQQNAAPVWTSASFSGSTQDQPRGPISKTLWLTWDIDQPRMWWRPASPTSGGAFIARPMEYYGPAVAGRPADKQWFTWGFHTAGEAFDFYFTDANGTSRYPATGFYSTNMDGVFVQEGQLYSYVPAATVTGARRDYDPANVPMLFSPQLDQARGYRVFLPRGYAEHPQRRYPVLYIHDGQNIFDQGTFGTWNAAATLGNLQATGQMQEVIAIGLDNVGDTRRADYSAPGDNNGRADLYISYILNTVKPLIDGQYRTLTDPASTAALGSSMGGVVSFYAGYDWNANFKRIGCLSTAWWLIPNYTAYIKAQPARADLRIYMDVGDTGSTSGGNNSDGYWDSLGVRDNFIGGAVPKYTLEGVYRFLVGFGQNHNETAWAARLPGALTFLFPSQGEPSTLLRTMFAPTWDTIGDGAMSIEDLYAINLVPADVNFDGAADAADARGVAKFLRRNEAADVAGP
jgi:predicted alpha/beta superfamily hydrolase